jgi:hypothetical protein
MSRPLGLSAFVGYRLFGFLTVSVSPPILVAAKSNNTRVNCSVVSDVASTAARMTVEIALELSMLVISCSNDAAASSMTRSTA